MIPQEARKIIAAAKKRGVTILASHIDTEVVMVQLMHPYSDGKTPADIVNIKMAMEGEGATPAHFKELIDWQMEVWK